MRSLEHPLAVFLRARGMSITEFASIVGLSRPFLSRLISGQRRGSRRPEIFLALSAATQGAVSVEQLLSWTPPRDRMPRKGRQ